MRNWRLPASDLTFGWDECRRCFYLKHVLGITRPRTPMAKVFNTIDRLMKEFYQGRRTEPALPFLPPGTVRFGDGWLQSVPLIVRNSSVTLTGHFDCAVELDDGTYVLVDYKTSHVKDVHVAFYSRQLHAYAVCLENPAPRRFRLGPVSRLGLIVVEPLRLVSARSLSFEMDLEWIPCERDDEAFLGFLDEVVAVLEGDQPPLANEGCDFCTYREMARAISA